MKLSELKILESKMSERDLDLQDAIADEFGLDVEDMMVDEIKAYLLDNKNSDKIDSFLQDHFENRMPQNDDPSNWVATKMESIFKKFM